MREQLLRSASLLVLVVTSLGAGVANVVSLWPQRPLVERPGFDDASAWLTQHAGTDAFVVVWPPSLAAALDHLPAGLAAADAVPLERSGARRFTRVFTLGPSNAEIPPQLLGVRELQDHSFGELRVREYDYGEAERVFYSLRDELPSVAVSSKRGAEILPCGERRSDGGWNCPGLPEWANVAPTALTVNGAPWPCVWAHPVTDRTLVLATGERLLGDFVRLQAALSDDAAATPGGTPIRLVLRVGEEERTLTRTNARGVATLELPTRQGARAQVTVEVTTPFDGRRHLGVNLELVERRSER